MPRDSTSRSAGTGPALEELDLVPIMNLVVCLIPMVLFGASFVPIGVVNANTKRFGEEAAASQEVSLGLTVALGEQGFYISSTGALIEGATIPKRGADYDFVDLYNRLVEVKTRFPDESVVSLTADERVPFHEIIRVMDVIRVRLDRDSYPDLQAFQGGAVRLDADGAPDLLWPDVLLAVVE